MSESISIVKPTTVLQTSNLSERGYSYFSLLNNLRDSLMKHVKQFDTSHTNNPPLCRNTGKPVAFIAFA